MITVTIPKKITKGEKLVVIPRREYEKFSHWRELLKQFKAFTPTPEQKRDLKRAREDYRKGRYITLHELKHELAAQNKN